MRRSTIPFALLVLLAACGGEDEAGNDRGPEPAPQSPPIDRKALTDPFLARETAPAKFRARFETTKGTFVVEAVREWAPEGVDRFYNLVRIGYFDDVAFFRVVKGFVVQFGLHGDPAVNAAWRGARIAHDPVRQSNTRGMVTFAQGGHPDTRTVQLFINLRDNTNLDRMNFSPIGRVVEGMATVDALYGGYGEATTQLQGQIAAQGNVYLQQRFPKLDYIKTARLVE